MIKLLATVGAAFLLAPAAAPAADYADPLADNGDAADIGAVRVQLAGDGYQHLRPEITAQPALFTAGSVLVAFDTDRSATTGADGGLLGADLLVAVDLADLSGAVLRWNGSDWEEPETQSGDVRYLVGAGTFELLVRPAVLGEAITSFGFSIFAATGAGEGSHMDRAPDAGMWVFDAAATPTVSTLDVTWSPRLPRAGSVFRPASVQLDLSDGTAVRPASYRCTATLGGKPLRGKGAGGCTFTIPKGAKGKRLEIVVVATYKGRRIPFDPYVFRVR
jgi:hypothetical protein